MSEMLLNPSLSRMKVLGGWPTQAVSPHGVALLQGMELVMMRWPLTVMLWVFERIELIVIILTCCLVVYLRSAHALYFTIGMYICGFAAKFLQSLIKQSRPTASTKETYGMPSAHSSTISYIALYTSWAAKHQRLHPAFYPHYLTSLLDSKIFDGQLSQQKSSTEFAVKCALTSSLWLLAVGVCWSRHYFRHHTPAQILAGAAFGAVAAFIWSLIWTNFLYECFNLNQWFKQSVKQVFINRTWNTNSSRVSSLLPLQE